MVLASCKASLSLVCLLLVSLWFPTALGQYGPDPDNVPPEFLCGWRKLALDYSTRVRPDSAAKVFDALQMDKYCSNATRPKDDSLFPPDSNVDPQAKHTFFVDGNNGSDSNPGTLDKPLKTIQRALDMAAGIQGATVVLRAGTFYLFDGPLMVTDRHQQLTIQNYKDEEVWLSGGQLLTDLNWQPYDLSSGKNVWKASLSGQRLGGKFEGLRVNGSRYWPARFPNANPETTAWPTGYLTSDKDDWLPPKISPHPNPAKVVKVTSPSREWDSMFTNYSGGIGGTCSIYDPPFSFWCASEFSPGCGGCFTWNIPGGLHARTLGPKNYTKPQYGYLMAWRAAHWANWAFEMDNYVAENQTILVGRGGFQGARGGPGSDYFVMNLLEEIDQVGEYYYDPDEQTLYVFANTSHGTPPSASTSFVALTQHTLINATGSSMSQAINGLTVRGIGFRDTAWTMLQPHGVPSGGDWALERLGALFLSNTEKATVDTIKMTRIGGNGIMLSKYNLGTHIVDSEFEWLGGSAIAAWGWTDELSDGGIHGIDGTGGFFPRYTVVEKNLFHEIGIWEKQSSAYFQAKTAQTVLRHNVVFNLARAGFNFNDGFGGGDNVTENVLFNTCRESSDHGPINSWDRQPFLTTIRNGTPSTQMEWRDIYHNIVIANYGGSKEVDTDDGSLFYRIHQNFMAYGWSQKFKIGAIQSFANLKAFVDLGGKFDAGPLTTPVVYQPNYWHNDTMIHLGTSPFDYRQCWSIPGHDFDKTRVFNNTIYVQSPSVKVNIDCGKQTLTLQEFQKQGNDPGTVLISSYPSSDSILGQARDILGDWHV